VAYPFDGGHLSTPSNLHPSTPREPASTKEAKEVYALVRDSLDQSNSSLVSSIGNWPHFACVLGLATEGMIDYIDHLL